jgi:TPR repeat protein
VYSGYGWHASELKIASLQAAAMANDVRAQYELGRILPVSECAVAWLLKACEQGHAHAQYQYAIYLRHNARCEKEHEEARAFALQSERQGYAEAQGWDNFHQCGALCARLSFRFP